MPIFTASQCFSGYPLYNIDESVSAPLVSLMGTNPRRWKYLGSDLLSIQCFLEITDQRLDLPTLTQPKGSDALYQFVAALFSSRFIDNPTPWVRASRLKQAFKVAHSGLIKFPEFPCTNNHSNWNNDFTKAICEFEDRELIEARVPFWAGWVATNALSKRTRLKLWSFYEKFGPLITGQLFGALSGWFLTSRSSGINGIDDFIHFTVAYSKEIDFSCSQSLGMLFQDFMPAFFVRREERGASLASSKKEWQCFGTVLYETLLGKDWATPLPAIARPRTVTTNHANSCVRISIDGTSIKHSLITPVPLHLTDSEAKELLFKDIEHEVFLLRRWAQFEVDAAVQRERNRHKIEKQGIPYEQKAVGVNTNHRGRISRDTPTYLSHAAATFGKYGFLTPERRMRAQLAYPSPLDLTAWELGLPMPRLLLAHASLLIIEHPRITTSFLENLYLFDKNGKQVGLQEVDGGWYLVGDKPRRGSHLAEQCIRLTKTSLAIVEEIITLTEPLRRWLSDRKSDAWRRLFLVCSSMGASPRLWRGSGEASRQVSWIAERISLATGLDPDAAIDLAQRYSLKRLRSSCGVLVYLRTGSLDEMARELGHATYSPNLLDRYLPKPIQDFFAERWIRIFQMGIVCEALRDSPLLLEATAFQSMSELDEFLENHAIRAIPKQFHTDDSQPDPAYAGTSLVFALDPSLLTMLISLEIAVRISTDQPCGKAIRWARISERLTAHLQSQTDQPEFGEMARVARSNADPTKVQSLIYG